MFVLFLSILIPFIHWIFHGTCIVVFITDWENQCHYFIENSRESFNYIDFQNQTSLSEKKRWPFLIIIYSDVLLFEIMLIVIQKGIIPQYFRKGHEINKSLYRASFSLLFFISRKHWVHILQDIFYIQGLKKKKDTKFCFFAVLNIRDIFYIPGFKQN